MKRFTLTAVIAAVLFLGANSETLARPGKSKGQQNRLGQAIVQTLLDGSCYDVAQLLLEDHVVNSEEIADGLCELLQKVQLRGAPAPLPTNPEEKALMCLPTGPEGTLQTEEVPVTDVQYWLDNGGQNGPCEGQEPPPAH